MIQKRKQLNLALWHPLYTQIKDQVRGRIFDDVHYIPENPTYKSLRYRIRKVRYENNNEHVTNT